jgi:hypothetical protein
MDHRAHRLLVLLLAAAAPLPAQGDGKVHYKNGDFAADALPATAPKALRESLAGYAPLLLKLKLRGFVAANDSCSLLHTTRLHDAAALQTTIDKTNALFADALGNNSDAEPYTVIVLEKQADVGVVLDHLLPKHAYLAEWAKTARNQAGFNLYEPPLYVVVNDVRPKTEFRLVNQVVHQQTLLILHRDFRKMPFWLHEGLAWVAEEDLTGRIHAFNHRVGFVAITEHTGWKNSLQNLCKSEPDWQRVFATVPTSYDKKLSLYAYGFARFLLQQPDHGKKLLAALGEAWWQKSGTGKTPAVELTADEQKKVIADVLGADFETRVLDSMRGT